MSGGFPKAIDFKDALAPVGFTNINEVFDLSKY
jgi:hypothetical protein